MSRMYEQAPDIPRNHKDVPGSFAHYELAYQLYPKIFEEQYDPAGPGKLGDRLHLRAMLKEFAADPDIMPRIDAVYGEPAGRERAAARLGSTAFPDMFQDIRDDAVKYRLLRKGEETPLSAQLKLGVIAYKHLSKSGKHTAITDPATRYVLHGIAREGAFAYQALFHTNQRMVISNARKYYWEGMGSSLDLSDLIAAGYYGLHRAIEKFNAGNDTDFYVYAKDWVMREAQVAVADMAKPIRYPSGVATKLSTINRIERDFEKRYQRDPSDSELADITGMDLKEVKSLRKWNEQTFVSTEESLHAGDDDSKSVMDNLASAPEAANPDEDEDLKASQDKLFRLIEEAGIHPGTALTPAELLIVSMRYRFIIESMASQMIAITARSNKAVLAEVQYEEAVLKAEETDKDGLATTKNIGKVTGITTNMAGTILNRAMWKLERTRERMEQLGISL
jgi:RNA polymerase sigma factor (sigma-70 family)